MKLSSRQKKILLPTLIVVILVFSVFTALKLDFDNHDGLWVNAIRDNPAALAAFQNLTKLTPQNAVIFTWWDYGRAVAEFGQRKAVAAYPSTDIIQYSGMGQDPVYSLEERLYGKFDSSQTIRDLATAFQSPELASLTIMQKYGATFVMVFHTDTCNGAFDDAAKFPVIVRIAGQDPTGYVVNGTQPGGCPYPNLPGPKAGNATMLRLIFDTEFPPQHFSKIFENAVAKIYQINYP